MKALFLMGRVEDIGPSVSLLWLAVATCCKSVPTLLPPEWFGHRPDDTRHLGHTELSQPHQELQDHGGHGALHSQLCPNTHSRGVLGVLAFVQQTVGQNSPSAG